MIENAILNGIIGRETSNELEGEECVETTDWRIHRGNPDFFTITKKFNT